MSALLALVLLADMTVSAFEVSRGDVEVAVADSMGRACLLDVRGRVYCQATGDGGNPWRGAHEIDFGGPVARIALAGRTLCAQRRDGEVWCRERSASPLAPAQRQLTGASGLVGGGTWWFCAIRAERAYCWQGQGDPIPVAPDLPVRQIAIGALQILLSSPSGALHAVRPEEDGTLRDLFRVLVPHRAIGGDQFMLLEGIDGRAYWLIDRPPFVMQGDRFDRFVRGTDCVATGGVVQCFGHNDGTTCRLAQKQADCESSLGPDAHDLVPAGRAVRWVTRKYGGATCVGFTDHSLRCTH